MSETIDNSSVLYADDTKNIGRGLTFLRLKQI